MARIHVSLVPACRALALIPLVCVMSGCMWSSDAVSVRVQNHTDETIEARDAAGWSYQLGDEVHIHAHQAESVVVDVFWYDADIEIEAAGGWHSFDLDISPFEYDEVLHVFPADVAPSGNG